MGCSGSLIGLWFIFLMWEACSGDIWGVNPSMHNAGAFAAFTGFIAFVMCLEGNSEKKGIGDYLGSAVIGVVVSFIAAKVFGMF